jgi:hypothetical protein
MSVANKYVEKRSKNINVGQVIKIEQEVRDAHGVQSLIAVQALSWQQKTSNIPISEGL